MGCHFLLQGIFPTQGSNPGLLHCRQSLYRLSYKGIIYSTNIYWKSKTSQAWPWQYSKEQNKSHFFHILVNTSLDIPFCPIPFWAPKCSWQGWGGGGCWLSDFWFLSIKIPWVPSGVWNDRNPPGHPQLHTLPDGGWRGGPRLGLDPRQEGGESSGVFGASVPSVRMDTRLRSCLSEARAAHRELRDWLP